MEPRFFVSSIKSENGGMEESPLKMFYYVLDELPERLEILEFTTKPTIYMVIVCNTALLLSIVTQTLLTYEICTELALQEIFWFPLRYQM